eukprot:4531285-Lingulodinium_polyedra.AAC.1
MSGGPRCPLATAHGAAAAAALASRTCGPEPFRQRAADVARDLESLAARDVESGDDRAAANDAQKV